MKPSLHFIALAFACCSSFGHAEEEQASSSPEVTTSRILGDIQDGTPPPPQPPQPKFLVIADEVLETEIYKQGGRKIIVQEINPIELPSPPLEASPVDIANPKLQKEIADFRDTHENLDFLFVGATIYYSKNLQTRSLVHIWLQGQGEPIALWSSADFGLLSGLSSFVASDGATHSLMMSWSTTDIDRLSDLLAKHGGKYSTPEIPDLPESKASFVVTSGNPSVENLAAIQSLHDLYNNQHDKLKAAFEDREHARLRQAAELKAHPPKPKNIVLNHWDIGESPPVEGGAK